MVDEKKRENLTDDEAKGFWREIVEQGRNGDPEDPSIFDIGVMPELIDALNEWAGCE